MKPPAAARDAPGGRHRIGPRDLLQFVYLAAAVVLVGFIGLFGFALLFNGITIYAWLFIAGAVWFRHGFIQYRNRLAVSGTATAKATSAAIGLAELSGRGHAQASEAPVTGTACLFWTVELEQWQARSKRHGWHRKLYRSYAVETLELEDDTGRVLVWTRGAEIIPVRTVWRSQDGDPPPAALLLVASTGLQWPPPSSRYPMKITEERVERDGPLYVMGTLAERRELPAMPPGFFPALLERWRRTTPQLDDRSFAAAFRFAGHGARRWLANDLSTISPSWSPPDVDPHQVLVWKGDQGRAFIIAGLLERDALTALSRQAWISILGGAGLMAGTVLVTLLKLLQAIR
jgi:hypothetical protein